MASDWLQGKVVLVNFWATWCAPCRLELPALDAYVRKMNSQDLVVYAVTTEGSVPDSKLKPLPKKVIRLPRLVGFYKLWEVEPKKTKVLYQVETDAGGSLPRWLAIFGAKALPYETLNRLRERVEGDS